MRYVKLSRRKARVVVHGLEFATVKRRSMLSHRYEIDYPHRLLRSRIVAENWREARDRIEAEIRGELERVIDDVTSPFPWRR